MAGRFSLEVGSLGPRYGPGAVEWFCASWLSACIRGLAKGRRNNQNSVTDRFNVLHDYGVIQNKLYTGSWWPCDWYLPDGPVPCSSLQSSLIQLFFSHFSLLASVPVCLSQPQ